MVQPLWEDRLEVSYKIKYVFNHDIEPLHFYVFTQKKLKFMFKPRFEHKCLLVIS